MSQEAAKKSTNESPENVESSFAAYIQRSRETVAQYEKVLRSKISEFDNDEFGSSEVDNFNQLLENFNRLTTTVPKKGQEKKTKKQIKSILYELKNLQESFGGSKNSGVTDAKTASTPSRPSADKLEPDIDIKVSLTEEAKAETESQADASEFDINGVEACDELMRNVVQMFAKVRRARDKLGYDYNETKDRRTTEVKGNFPFQMAIGSFRKHYRAAVEKMKRGETLTLAEKEDIVGVYNNLIHLHGLIIKEVEEKGLNIKINGSGPEITNVSEDKKKKKSIKLSPSEMEQLEDQQRIHPNIFPAEDWQERKAKDKHLKSLKQRRVEKKPTTKDEAAQAPEAKSDTDVPRVGFDKVEWYSKAPKGQTGQRQHMTGSEFLDAVNDLKRVQNQEEKKNELGYDTDMSKSPEGTPQLPNNAEETLSPKDSRKREQFRTAETVKFNRLKERVDQFVGHSISKGIDLAGVEDYQTVKRKLAEIDSLINGSYESDNEAYLTEKIEAETAVVDRLLEALGSNKDSKEKEKSSEPEDFREKAKFETAQTVKLNQINKRVDQLTKGFTKEMKASLMSSPEYILITKRLGQIEDIIGQYDLGESSEPVGGMYGVVSDREHQVVNLTEQIDEKIASIESLLNELRSDYNIENVEEETNDVTKEPGSGEPKVDDNKESEPGEPKTPGSEKSSHQERMESDPDYKQWYESRQESDRLTREFQDKYKSYLEDGSLIKKGGLKIKNLFGFRPRLTPELAELKQQSEAARASHLQQARELASKRVLEKAPTTHAEAGDSAKVIERYQRMLAYKEVINPAQKQVEIQKGALEGLNPDSWFGKTVGFLQQHRKGRILLTAAGYGVLGGIGASGGFFAAGAAASGTYLFNVGRGFLFGGAAGLATRHVGREGWTKAKEEELTKSTGRLAQGGYSGRKLFDREFDFNQASTDFERVLFAKEASERRVKTAAAGAAIAAGVGSAYAVHAFSGAHSTPEASPTSTTDSLSAHGSVGHDGSIIKTPVAHDPASETSPVSNGPRVIGIGKGDPGVVNPTDSLIPRTSSNLDLHKGEAPPTIAESETPATTAENEVPLPKHTPVRPTGPEVAEAGPRWPEHTPELRPHTVHPELRNDVFDDRLPPDAGTRPYSADQVPLPHARPEHFAEVPEHAPLPHARPDFYPKDIEGPVTSGITYTAERNDNFWDVAEGQTHASQPPTARWMQEHHPAEFQKFIKLSEEFANKDPVLRHTLGFGDSMDELKEGATVDLGIMEAMMNHVAHENGWPAPDTADSINIYPVEPGHVEPSIPEHGPILHDRPEISPVNFEGSAQPNQYMLESIDYLKANPQHVIHDGDTFSEVVGGNSKMNPTPTINWLRVHSPEEIEGLTEEVRRLCGFDPQVRHLLGFGSNTDGLKVGSTTDMRAAEYMLNEVAKAKHIPVPDTHKFLDIPSAYTDRIDKLVESISPENTQPVPVPRYIPESGRSGNNTWI